MAHRTMSDNAFREFLKPSAPTSARLILTGVVLSVLFLVGCGGSPTKPGQTPTPTPTPTPVTPVPTPPTPFTQTLTGTMGSFSSADWLKHHEFTAPRDGAATITLTWATGAVDLDLALTDAACTTGANCSVFQGSTASTGTIERVTRNMKAGEAYRVWIQNYSSVGQGYSVEIDIR